jgi:hypothetical protein
MEVLNSMGLSLSLSLSRGVVVGARLNKMSQHFANPRKVEGEVYL